jgi:hypothetical protein
MVPHPVASSSRRHYIILSSALRVPQLPKKSRQGGSTRDVAVEDLEAKSWSLLQPNFAPPVNDETPVVTQEEL